MIKGTVPHRLDLIYINQPLYFVTFLRLATAEVFPRWIAPSFTFQQYAQLREGANFNVAVGRYVIMPDHVHLFVRGDRSFTLSSWIGGLKRAIVCGAKMAASLASLDFFDHILRSDESYRRENGTTCGTIRSALAL